MYPAKTPLAPPGGATDAAPLNEIDYLVDDLHYRLRTESDALSSRMARLKSGLGTSQFGTGLQSYPHFRPFLFLSHLFSVPFPLCKALCLYSPYTPSLSCFISLFLSSGKLAKQKAGLTKEWKSLELERGKLAKARMKFEQEVDMEWSSSSTSASAAQLGGSLGEVTAFDGDRRIKLNVGGQVRLAVHFQRPRIIVDLNSKALLCTNETFFMLTGL